MNLIIALLALLKQHREIHGSTWKIPVLSSFIKECQAMISKKKTGSINLLFSLPQPGDLET